jgi:hypothetical protein
MPNRTNQILLEVVVHNADEADAKEGPNVLFFMPNRTNLILLKVVAHDADEAGAKQVLLHQLLHGFLCGMAPTARDCQRLAVHRPTSQPNDTHSFCQL